MLKLVAAKPRELRGTLARLTLLNYMSNYVVARSNVQGIVIRCEIETIRSQASIYINRRRFNDYPERE